MEARTVLAHLREGRPLREDELRFFARGLASGDVTDAQAAAFAMGVCRGGMSEAETVALTRAMRDSGEVLHWDLPGPVLDKHSTGGLGDSTSLIVAPVLAAVGAYAPFLSGRGLGHTGGTLDKLEALEGLETTMSNERLKAIVADVGCAVVGASTEIAPADRRLYALRHATATVESPALITASILSKKLAAGAQALILDVKGGSGAFMKTRSEAKALAQLLVNTANAAGCATRALITDMNQPLAPAIGNAVELAEVLKVLRDPRPESRLCALSLALTGELLELAGVHATAESGARAALQALQSGAAAEKFGAMVHAMKGPAKLMETPERFLAAAPVTRNVRAERTGKVAAIDGVALGQVVAELGGQRLHPGDHIDPRVGLTDIVSLGTAVSAGETLAQVHAVRDDAADAAVAAVRAAIQIGPEAVTPPLIYARVNS
ncbi:MAG: thymidine phosphorylase [Rhodobacteraceae bacterium]|nr:thymidine phosphorylase [Paracoccaceae bacterium]